jgi:tetratricopeptide (TPR) repeat protein
METQETGIPEAGTATYNTAFTSFRLPPNNRKRQRLLRPSPFPAEDDRAEDEAAKAECTALLEEANKMASNPRGDEDLATALSRWDAALRIMNASAAAGGGVEEGMASDMESLVSKLSRIHESRAQVFLALDRDFEAVRAAESSTNLDPSWAEGWLTLGRAQHNLGEPALAAASFQTALELNVSPQVEAEANDDLALANEMLAVIRGAKSSAAPLEPTPSALVDTAASASAANEGTTASTPDEGPQLQQNGSRNRPVDSTAVSCNARARATARAFAAHRWK